MSDPTSMRKPADKRPRFTFTIPESERQLETDPHTLTFAPLRTYEELDAGKVAQASKGDTGIAYMNEAVRRSVVEVDGSPVNWADPLSAEWLERCGPKVRGLAKRAYNEVHAPSDEGAEAFLASMTAQVVPA